MSQHEHVVPELDGASVELGPLGRRIAVTAGTVGAVSLAAAAGLGVAAGDGLRHFSFSYLVSFAYFLSISLGALVFLPLQYVTRSSWSVVIRRLAEVTAMTLPLLAVLMLPILLNLDALYAWAGPAAAHPDPLLAHKQPFLSTPFFALRWVIYFAIWITLALYFWRTSRKQDATRDVGLTLRMTNRSGPAIVVFALTCSLAGMDLLMTLDYAWFSTMFGVYYWAGGFVAFFSLMTLFTLFLQRNGRLVSVVTVEHYHDYGKLMFAFTFFWAYIAFSQYMLYWYANIPEETLWFLVRQSNGWEAVGLLLVFGAWLLPFAGLMSRFTKRRKDTLTFFAAWIAVMQWFNLYWVTMPVFSPERVPISPLDPLCFLGIGGLWLAAIARLASADRLVPVGDPRLADSLTFENA